MLPNSVLQVVSKKKYKRSESCQNSHFIRLDCPVINDLFLDVNYRLFKSYIKSVVLECLKLLFTIDRLDKWVF